MLVYLIKCAVVLVGLWLARYFHLLPWSLLISVLSTVIVPLVLIVAAAIRAKRQTLMEITDVVAPPAHQDSPGYAPAVRRRS
jgi:hypothetical protein